jgi:hypothetical protein
LNKVGSGALLWFGYLPAVWFISVVSIAGSLVRDYSSISQQASELTLIAGAPRIVVDIAALGVGIFLSVFSIELWRASGKAVAFGALAWILFALSMASNALWVMGNPMHGLYGLGFSVIIAPALSALEMGAAGQDRQTYCITGLISFVGIVYFWLNVLGFDPPHYRGLTQRIYACLILLWPAWAAHRLGRVSRRLGAQ